MTNIEVFHDFIGHDLLYLEVISRLKRKSKKLDIARIIDQVDISV